MNGNTVHRAVIGAVLGIAAPSLNPDDYNSLESILKKLDTHLSNCNEGNIVDYGSISAKEKTGDNIVLYSPYHDDKSPFMWIGEELEGGVWTIESSQPELIDGVESLIFDSKEDVISFCECQNAIVKKEKLKDELYEAYLAAFEEGIASDVNGIHISYDGKMGTASETVG